MKWLQPTQATLNSFHYASAANTHDPRPGDLYLSILPCWHVFERAAELFMLARGATVVYTTKLRFKSDLLKYRRAGSSPFHPHPHCPNPHPPSPPHQPQPQYSRKHTAQRTQQTRAVTLCVLTWTHSVHARSHYAPIHTCARRDRHSTQIHGTNVAFFSCFFYFACLLPSPGTDVHTRQDNYYTKYCAKDFLGNFDIGNVILGKFLFSLLSKFIQTAAAFISLFLPRVFFHGNIANAVCSS